MAKIATNIGKSRHTGSNYPMAILYIPPGLKDFPGAFTDQRNVGNRTEIRGAL
jgi:hypothetical protein